MRTILIFLLLSTLFYSCDKQEIDPDKCVANVKIYTWHDSTRPVNVSVYANIRDYLNKENPISEYKDLKHGAIISTEARRNAILYYDINSDDFSTTNWASKDFTVEVTANSTNSGFFPETRAYYRRMLLPENAIQSKWKMVSFLNEYGQNIIKTIPEYLKHRILIINRNQRATYQYLAETGDTVVEEFLFDIHNESWSSITNSFIITFFDADIPGGVEARGIDMKYQKYYASGPISPRHPTFTHYSNPPNPPIMLPETDSLLFYSSDQNKANVIFKRQ